MLTVPLAQVPAQSLQIKLGDQQCEITIVEKFAGGVFLSLKANSVQILTNMVCRDRVVLCRYDYLPFVGQLFFVDTQGTSDPTYTGFGTRFKLGYVP